MRIEAGVPMGGREVTESTIAAEVGLVERTVSFTKGCFTGQELVARLDARGSKVARRLCGVVVAGDRRRRWGPRCGRPTAATRSGTLTSVAWSTGPRGHGGPGHPAPPGGSARGRRGALGRR